MYLFQVYTHIDILFQIPLYYSHNKIFNTGLCAIQQGLVIYPFLLFLSSFLDKCSKPTV